MVSDLHSKYTWFFCFPSQDDPTHIPTHTHSYQLLISRLNFPLLATFFITIFSLSPWIDSWSYDSLCLPKCIRQNYNTQLLEIQPGQQQQQIKYSFAFPNSPSMSCFWLAWLEERAHDSVIEFSLEGTSGGHITQPPALNSYIKLLRNSSSQSLNMFKEGDSLSSQDNMHMIWIYPNIEFIHVNATSSLELISIWCLEQNSKGAENSTVSYKTSDSTFTPESTPLKFHLVSPSLDIQLCSSQNNRSIASYKKMFFIEVCELNVQKILNRRI